MKKKLLIILFCGVVFLNITGCKTIKNEFKVGGESDIQIVKNNISLSVKEGTLTNEGAIFILKNNSEHSIEYGNPYELEIKQDGVWHKINVELSFTLPVFELKPNESEELEINWVNGYGKLAKGDYRFIKQIGSKNTNNEYENFRVSAEFSIV